MKAIKNLIVASTLLMVSSIGFASTVSPIGSTLGSEGTISLTTDGDNASIGGFFAGELDLNIPVTHFYDLNVAGESNVMAGATSFHFSPLTFIDATLSVFQAGIDGMFFGSVDDTLIATGTGSLIAFGLLATENYYLAITGAQGTSYNGDVSAVPVPAAGILFASALFGAGALSRRKKKAAKSNMIGAFARAA